MTMFHHQECLVRNFEQLAVLVYLMHQLVNPRTLMIVNVFLVHLSDSPALSPYRHSNENRCAEDLHGENNRQMITHDTFIVRFN